MLVFASLALFSRWLVNQQLEKVDTTQSEQRSTIDYELENFIARNFGEDGHLVFQMTAPRMSRDTLTGETLVISPRILWPQKKDNKKITLVANSGLISDDQDEISLTGRVIVKSRSSDIESELEPTIIRTEELAFHQTDRLLSSTSLISITAPGVQLSSIGMSADLENDKINLKQQVKGQYETQ